jgi:tetratricopeptide (TPR) repeat protein
LGEAQRRAGDVGHRETLLAAAKLAERQGDTAALARAALANSRGVMYSVTGAVDSERVAALEAALASSTGEDSDVRARLLSTLAMELTFSPDPDRRQSLSDEALAIARRLGDRATLAHVLLARYAATLRPETLQARLSDAEELIETVSSLPDPALRTRALIVAYRTVLQAGRMGEAARLLQAADELSEELAQPALRWMTTYLRSAYALIAGDLGSAERLARDAAEHGRIGGQADAPWQLALQMFLIRREQGQTDEELDTLFDAAGAGIDAAGARLHSIEAAGALAAADLGRTGEARAVYDRLVASPPPLDLYWAIATVMWAQLAMRLGETAQVEVLYEALRPYHDHVVPFPPFPAPSMSFHLGALAAFLGRFDEADRHFATAATDHERIGAPTYLARTRLEWARALLARGEAGDDARAHALLTAASGAAREFGLLGVERDATALLGR